jgi:hypothetical protein
MDDGTEDDPFRVVMISDIEPWLFMVPEALLKGEVGQLLLDAFLIFCGLPPAMRSSPWVELAFADQFTSRVVVNATDASNLMPADGPEEVQRKPPAFSNQLNAAMSPGLLFAGPNWFHYFGSVMQDLAVDTSFVINVWKQLVHDAGVEDLALYYLGFTFAKEPLSVKKLAKALLKKYPNNSDLYNAYALAAFANGDADVANKVLLSAMEAPSVSAIGHVQSCLFH